MSMQDLSFKKWMEIASLGGIEPPKQSPIDPTPAPGQTNALQTYHSSGSDELPPINGKMKKKMKKKMKNK